MVNMRTFNNLALIYSVEADSTNIKLFNIGLVYSYIMCGSRGGGTVSGPPPPLKITKNIGFRINTGQGPLATKPVFNVELSSVRWWADDGQLLVLY